jgi:hypothetical protein
VLVILVLPVVSATPAGPTICRGSVQKLAACVQAMNEEGVRFLVEPGGFKDQDTPSATA